MSRNCKISVLIIVLISCFIFVYEKEVKTYSPNDINENRYDFFSSNKIKYVGHRGIDGLAPENTLFGFNLAGRLGYWGTECDARTTVDGHWMILHDDTVDRTTNGTGPIRALTLKAVQSLNIIPTDAVINYPRAKIPKLQDYLLICKEWGMVAVIEMKPGDNFQYYDKFLEIIKKYGDIEKTIVISSSVVSLNELRKRDTYLTLGLLCSNINDSNIYYVKTLRNAFIDCPFRSITKSAVVLCHKNNIKVGAWTVDDKVIADNLIQTGVGIITTNKLLPRD